MLPTATGWRRVCLYTVDDETQVTHPCPRRHPRPRRRVGALPRRRRPVRARPPRRHTTAASPTARAARPSEVRESTVTARSGPARSVRPAGTQRTLAAPTATRLRGARTTAGPGPRVTPRTAAAPVAAVTRVGRATRGSATAPVGAVTRAGRAHRVTPPATTAATSVRCTAPTTSDRVANVATGRSATRRRGWPTPSDGTATKGGTPIAIPSGPETGPTAAAQGTPETAPTSVVVAMSPAEPCGAADRSRAAGPRAGTALPHATTGTAR